MTGQFVAGNGTCVTCPAGRFTPRSGLAACLVCPSGYFNEYPGVNKSLHVSCSACPQGRYHPTASFHDS